MTTHHLMLVDCLEEELTACLDVIRAASRCHWHLLCVIDLAAALDIFRDMSALAQRCIVFVVA